MKRIYLYSLALISMFLVSVASQAKTKVELMGSLLTGQTRYDDGNMVGGNSVGTMSMRTSQPLSTYNLNAGVYTAFNADLGYVLVEIVSVDTEEVISSSLVDSAFEDSFISAEDLEVNEDYYVRYTTVYGDASGDLF